MAVKKLEWIGSSKTDVRECPDEVREEVGYALWLAQNGDTSPSAKMLKGFGGGRVFEIVANDRSGTYRAVYTVKFPKAVYVLHVFQKKSKSGIATPRHEIELIRQRLNAAEEMYAESYPDD